MTTYVITCGDEGVQLNSGTRLGVVGAGVSLEDFNVIATGLKKTFETVLIAASAENAWTKQVLNLNTWEQTDASAQQHVQVVADANSIEYVGFIPFSDPKELAKGVKGHMVRPHGIHIANKVSLTVGGGEQTFHLGHFVISADWVHTVKPAQAAQLIQTQIDFYTQLSGQKTLKLEIEEGGELDESIKEKNKSVLQQAGFAL